MTGLTVEREMIEGDYGVKVEDMETDGIRDRLAGVVGCDK